MLKKLFSGGSKKEKAPSKGSSSNSNSNSRASYIVIKKIGDESLNKIEFSGNEGKEILKKLGFKPKHMENKTWSFPMGVMDDDTGKKYSLQLRQDEKFGPFGFYQDWATQVVSDRISADGSEEIGFYVHPKTKEIHFSVLNADIEKLMGVTVL